MELAKTERFAVVTVAGSGLGRCFALELAGRGLNTILGTVVKRIKLYNELIANVI